MSVNPKLVKRFNNRHSIKEAYAKYYPFEVGQNDDLPVGALVQISEEPPQGERPKGDELDMRTVEVSRADASGYYVRTDEAEHTVFLKDLSPVRIGSGR
jgi:hypothetical protein